MLTLRTLLMLTSLLLRLITACIHLKKPKAWTAQTISFAQTHVMCLNFLKLTIWQPSITMWVLLKAWRQIVKIRILKLKDRVIGLSWRLKRSNPRRHDTHQSNLRKDGQTKCRDKFMASSLAGIISFPKWSFRNNSPLDQKWMNRISQQQ